MFLAKGPEGLLLWTGFTFVSNGITAPSPKPCLCESLCSNQTYAKEWLYKQFFLRGYQYCFQLRAFLIFFLVGG